MVPAASDRFWLVSAHCTTGSTGPAWRRLFQRAIELAIAVPSVVHRLLPQWPFIERTTRSEAAIFSKLTRVTAAAWATLRLSDANWGAPATGAPWHEMHCFRT